MRKRNIKIILGTLAVAAVLGTGVAVAATQAQGPGGHGPQVTNMATGMGMGDQRRVHARDGTGPRHDEMQSRMQQHLRDGTGPRHDERSAQNADRGANCPYRS